MYLGVSAVWRTRHEGGAPGFCGQAGCASLSRPAVLTTDKSPTLSVDRGWLPKGHGVLARRKPISVFVPSCMVLWRYAARA
jgi:hypothetical protein